MTVTYSAPQKQPAHKEQRKDRAQLWTEEEVARWLSKRGERLDDWHLFFDHCGPKMLVGGKNGGGKLHTMYKRRTDQ